MRVLVWYVDDDAVSIVPCFDYRFGTGRELKQPNNIALLVDVDLVSCRMRA